MKKTYLNEWRNFKENLSNFFVILTALYFLSAFTGYALSFQNPQFAHSSFESIKASFESRGFFETKDNFSLFFLIIINNIAASFICVFFGIIPFLFLPALIIVSNGFLLGIIGGVLALKKTSLFIMLISVLPHGLFELPTLFYGGSLGLYLTLAVSKKILGKPGPSVKKTFCDTVRSFLFVILPLLIIAAFMEAFVTYAIIKGIFKQP